MGKKLGGGEIGAEFSGHKNLREKALLEPTKKLLTKTISSDNRFVIKLIIKNAIELVESSDLEYAQEVNPDLVPFLNNVLGIVKKLKHFRNIVNEDNFSIEITQLIQQFVTHNV